MFNNNKEEEDSFDNLKLLLSFKFFMLFLSRSLFDISILCVDADDDNDNFSIGTSAEDETVFENLSFDACISLL